MIKVFGGEEGAAGDGHGEYLLLVELATVHLRCGAVKGW